MAVSAEETRRDILAFLVGTRLRGDVPPTVREIGEAVGLSSSRSIHRHIERLKEERLVSSVEGRQRTLVVTERGMQAVGEFPVMGRIAAGRGLEAIPAEDETYSLFASLLLSDRGGRRYVLRVVGQSMTGAGIADGDMLVIEENESPPNGAVVVALIGGGDEVTVKVLHREGESVRLAAKNGDHKDIVLLAEDVRIQGEVVFVIHPPRR